MAQLALIGPETLDKIISEEDKDSIGYSYSYNCDYCTSKFLQTTADFLVARICCLHDRGLVTVLQIYAYVKIRVPCKRLHGLHSGRASSSVKGGEGVKNLRWLT